MIRNAQKCTYFNVPFKRHFAIFCPKTFILGTGYRFYLQLSTLKLKPFTPPLMRMSVGCCAGFCAALSKPPVKSIKLQLRQAVNRARFARKLQGYVTRGELQQ